tara:strand:- start:956 stop:1207 length:252 start_codon:yes stop_codon:yes gene_type:complete
MAYPPKKTAGETISTIMAAGQAVPPKGETAEKVIARKKRQLQRKARPQDKGISTKKKREAAKDAAKAAQEDNIQKGSIKPNQA